MTTITHKIARQIGQRAFFMLGTIHPLADEKSRSLSFDIRGSPQFNKVRVTLDLDDTYTVEFFKFRKFKIVAHLERNGIYADGLHQCIEHNTGLALSL